MVSTAGMPQVAQHDVYDVAGKVNMAGRFDRPHLPDAACRADMDYQVKVAHMVHRLSTVNMVVLFDRRHVGPVKHGLRGGPDSAIAVGSCSGAVGAGCFRDFWQCLRGLPRATKFINY